MSRNRAITIDLDDTLWDCHPVIREAESKLWEWLETNYPKISDNYTQEMDAENHNTRMVNQEMDALSEAMDG